MSIRRPTEDTARLGREIYEREIRAQVETEHHGDVVAIDVDSGSWAVGANAIEASGSLRTRHPEAIDVWLHPSDIARCIALAAVPCGGADDRRGGERRP